jgi:hypothetical protein
MGMLHRNESLDPVELARLRTYSLRPIDDRDTRRRHLLFVWLEEGECETGTACEV